MNVVSNNYVMCFTLIKKKSDCIYLGKIALSPLQFVKHTLAAN